MKVMARKKYFQVTWYLNGLLIFIHLFHYVIIQHEKDTIGRKILMFLLSVNTIFTLAILFSLILWQFMLYLSTDSNTPSDIHISYMVLGLK